MPHYRIVLVEPKFQGNIGAVARSMMNFDMDSLYLVNPCEIDDDAYRRSKHAKKLLLDSRIVSTFEEAIRGVDLVVGSSSAATDNEKKFNRIPLTPKELRKKMDGFDGEVALVFGREDIGLLNEELQMCDILVTIPAGKEYPVLNLSHAATIVLYELYTGKLSIKKTEADAREREKLFEHFERILPKVGYPEHKREKTTVMFRRMLGRSAPSRWEYHTLMGVFSHILWAVDEEYRRERQEKRRKEHLFPEDMEDKTKEKK